MFLISFILISYTSIRVVSNVSILVGFPVSCLHLKPNVCKIITIVSMDNDFCIGVPFKTIDGSLLIFYTRFEYQALAVKEEVVVVCIGYAGYVSVMKQVLSASGNGRESHVGKATAGKAITSALTVV